MSVASSDYPSFMELVQYGEMIASTTPSEVGAIRTSLFQEINGNIFYKLDNWPQHMRLLFWKKPTSDQETFKLVLFMIGNGCSPYIVSQWILSSQKWSNYHAIRARCYQLSWIYNNLSSKSSHWFYYDIMRKLFIHMDGTLRQMQS